MVALAERKRDSSDEGVKSKEGQEHKEKKEKTRRVESGAGMGSRIHDT